MADLCARAEHCTSEIRDKLRKLGISSADSEAIITYLQDNRYIDDNRFAAAFTRDKIRFSGWGKLKVRAALAMKRIDSSIIREAADEIDEEVYQEAAMKAAETKSRGLDLSSYDDRTRLFRHLASRGFEPSLISKTIRLLISRMNSEL